MLNSLLKPIGIKIHPMGNRVSSHGDVRKPRDGGDRWGRGAGSAPGQESSAAERLEPWSFPLPHPSLSPQQRATNFTTVLSRREFSGRQYPLCQITWGLGKLPPCLPLPGFFFPWEELPTTGNSGRTNIKRPKFKWDVSFWGYGLFSGQSP